MTYEIQVRVKFDVELEIEADTEKMALELAYDEVEDYFRLSKMGTGLVEESLDVRLTAYKIED